jgi:hypothetical protein
MLFTLSTISSKKLDTSFLHPKTGPSAFYPHFFFPQVDSLALFAPTSGIKDVFRVKIRPFLVLTTY